MNKLRFSTTLNFPCCIFYVKDETSSLEDFFLDPMGLSKHISTIVLVSKKTEKGNNQYVIPNDLSSSPGGIYIIKLITSKIHKLKAKLHD